MNKSFDRLIAISSEPIGDTFVAADVLNDWGSIGQELAELLNLKNGFYAYESALLIRPLHSRNGVLGLIEWNTSNLWKNNYIEPTYNAFFFAEDIFGSQFCIREGMICTFDPETGLFEAMSSSLEECINDIMHDYEFRTGFPLAHAWQIKNQQLNPGVRLLPKIPFLCGGKYEVDNLYSLADVKGMLFRASIANQIRNLPDGAEFVFEVT